MSYSEPRQANTHDEGVPIFRNEIAFLWILGIFDSIDLIGSPPFLIAGLLILCERALPTGATAKVSEFGTTRPRGQTVECRQKATTRTCL